MAILMTVDQKIETISVSFTDRAGNPVVAPGMPEWTVSDAAILAIAVSEDGMSVSMDTVGGVGDAQVRVAFGEIAAALDFTVSAGAPRAAVLTATDPTAR